MKHPGYILLVSLMNGIIRSSSRIIQVTVDRSVVAAATENVGFDSLRFLDGHARSAAIVTL